MHPHLKGLLAEKAALCWFLAHGWVPARRPPASAAQIDLLLTPLWPAPRLLVAEVKYRARLHGSAPALGPAQLRRQQAASRTLLKYWPAAAVSHTLLLVSPRWPFFRAIPL